MVIQADFPRTENEAVNHPDRQVSGIETLQSVKIYQPSHSISLRKARTNPGKIFDKQSFYEGIKSQWRRGFGQVDTIIQRETLLQEYTQISMLQVNPIDIEQNLAIPTSPTIPESSPIHPLLCLKTGWDGYWAEPLSQVILPRANQLWRKIEQITINRSNLPTVQPAANGSVAFVWSCEYPEKELEIWLYDQLDYYAEWILSDDDQDEEDTAQSQADLLKVIKRYQEL